MLRRFRLEEPESVRAASDLLARYGESAKVYAGGTELLLAMKEGLIHYERLINIKKVPDLDQVKLEDGAIRIGALSTHRKLGTSPVLQERLPAFVQMEHNVANIRVREVGTLGGNLSFAEPHADPGTLLLVLGAKLSAEKASSRREIPMDQFFVDAYETCLEPDELLIGIEVPLLPTRSGVTYLKFGYLERPSVGVALLLTLDRGDSIADARIAVGCVGPTPRRIEEAEGLLKGRSVDEASQLVVKAGEIAAGASQAISDLHGSKDYKEHIVQVLLKRAFHKAYGQCLPEGKGEREVHV
ncbi:MAG: xanthine dehydrogenase family protein subunit M [Deltaproteobacteria bacterium]|nr:xanthine dehydrogenase family protein subunit M [Deltaproteobacteria bacterium]